MDPKKFPFLPLHYFLSSFPAASRFWFWGVWLLLLLSCGLTLWHHADPVHWALELREVPDTLAEEVPVKTVTSATYRSFELRLNAFRQKVSFSASPLLPAEFPVYLFLALQAIAWSVFLAAITFIRSRWIYLFYGLFVLFFHFSHIAQVIFPADEYHLVELGLLLSYLGLGYVFQMNYLRWELGGRILVMLGLSTLWLGLAFFLGDWPARHEMTLNAYPFMVLLSVLFFYFIAKEPTNLLVAAATNRPDRRSRLDWRLLLALNLVLLLMEFILIDEYLRFGLFGEFQWSLRPAYLIAIAALFTVFTSQNHYPFLRDVFTTQRVFVFVLLSLSLAVMSFLMLQFTYGDPVLIFTIERLALLFFFGFGVAHVFYLFSNFLPLLRQKFHVYYLLTRGPRISLYIPFLVALIVFISAEGKEGWKSYKLYYHSLINQVADNHWLRGDRQKARDFYEMARRISPVSPKANYNLASLDLAEPQQAARAIGYYQEAVSFYAFPHARLNGAQLMAFLGDPQAAIEFLRGGLKEAQADPYLANNLALLYWQAGQPDSAIVAFKQALLSDLSQGGIYTNLAQLYEAYDRPQEAQQFYQAAMASPDPGVAAQLGAHYYQLKSGQALDLPEATGTYDDYFLNYNRLLSALDQAEAPLYSPKLKEMVQENAGPDALLLDAYLMFQQDSIEHAVSRIEFLANSYERHAARSYELLALAYLDRGVPEMARKYFFEAGEAGDPQGYLRAAQMDIDLGRAEPASLRLAELRATYPELWEPVSKELAILLAAYGQPVYAGTEWNLAELSWEEQLRIGIYADSMNQYITALESFRRVLLADSIKVAPFLEMGRIYNRYGDSLALENLRFGLARDSSSVALRSEYVQALLLQGSLVEAGPWIEALPDSLRATQHLAAAWALARGDTVRADSLWQRVLAAHPLDQQSVLGLARLSDARQDYGASLALLNPALALNSENPYFWYYYARASRGWGREGEARFAAKQAVEKAFYPAEQQRWREEFEDLLAVGAGA
jgi:tetratricopeptide (TPR) repeat protein